MEPPARSLAAEPEPRAPMARPLVDHRPSAAAQRALLQTLRTGPAMAAQRRALQAAFGDAARFEAIPQDEALPATQAPAVTQRAAAGGDPDEDEVQADPEAAAVAPEPVSGELEAENAAEHGGDLGGPGDDDRVRREGDSAQLKRDPAGSGGTVQLARGLTRGAATAAALAIAETVGAWGARLGGGLPPVPHNANQARTVNGVPYLFRNDGQGFVEFVNPAAGYGPALAAASTVDIRPWFMPHNRAIRNAIETTRYNHFLAANEARAQGLTGYPNNVRHSNADFDAARAANPDGGASPAGFTWHHHGTDVGRMELIDRDVHAAVRHSGGYSAWGS